jgi:hypothetical protein
MAGLREDEASERWAEGAQESSDMLIAAIPKRVAEGADRPGPAVFEGVAEIYGEQDRWPDETPEQAHRRLPPGNRGRAHGNTPTHW